MKIGRVSIFAALLLRVNGSAKTKACSTLMPVSSIPDQQHFRGQRKLCLWVGPLTLSHPRRDELTLIRQEWSRDVSGRENLFKIKDQ